MLVSTYNTLTANVKRALNFGYYNYYGYALDSILGYILTLVLLYIQ